MSSMLRSSKFIRYFAGITRNIVFSAPREPDGNIFQRTQCLASVITSNYATVAAQSKGVSDLDMSIKRLDEDVRKTGRISRKDIEDILTEMQQRKSATSTQSLMIIRCCGNLVPEETPEFRTQLVNEIWNTFEKLGVPVDISHYNALLRVYLENEHHFSPTEFLANLSKKGVEPNRVTYQRLIAGYCQRGDISGATQILEYMKEKQLPVSESVFNALILGHSKADDMESAEGILSVMQQAGLEPSSETYTTLLCGYAAKGDISGINKVIETCEKKDVFLADRDLLEVVYTLAISNKPELVDSVLEKVRKMAGYNQDAANVILRLITKGQEDVAFKVFNTMARPVRFNGTSVFLGSFVIKHLVKSKRPIEKVIQFCKQLKDEGANSRSYMFATEASFHQDNPHYSLKLLRALADSGEQVRLHYFWPVLVQAGKSSKSEGIKNVLCAMLNDFNMFPNTETLRDYVIPYLDEKNSDEIVNTLMDTGLKRGTSAAAVISHLLVENKLREAAEIGLNNSYIKFNQILTPQLLIPPLLATDDVEAFVDLIHLLVMSYEHTQPVKGNEVEEDEDDGALSQSKEEIVGKFVLELVKSKYMNLKNVLQVLLDRGLGITNNCAEQIQSKLSDNQLTPDISSLLAKLASGDLTTSTLNVKQSSEGGSRFVRNPDVLEKIVLRMKENNENPEWAYRSLFFSYCNRKESDNALRIKKEIESSGGELTSTMLSALMELHVNLNNEKEAMECLAAIKEKDQDFFTDRLRVIRIANYLVEMGKYDDAIELLKQHGPTLKSSEDEKHFLFNSFCWRMLNTVAEKKDPESVKVMLNILTDNGYTEVNNVLLGPLIKAYLLKDDMKGALDEFENCCRQYRATPWKNELTCKLIQAEDANSLQRLTDLSTEVHGEVNSLYDLVLAFVECGRVRQARKILETPGLRPRNERLQLACERYKNDGLVAPLEGLVEATKDMSHIDRSEIYYNLLLSYEKNSEVDKALGLWTQMQEEDVNIPDEFLLALGRLLKQSGRPVPFDMTNLVQREEKSEENAKKTEHYSRVSEGKKQLSAALLNGNIDRAIGVQKRLEDSGYQVPRQYRTEVIEQLVKAGRIGEATKVMSDWLQAKTIPHLSVLKLFINRLAQTGDVNSFRHIGELLDDKLRRIVSYDNKLTTCMNFAGEGKKVLDELEKNIDEAKTPEEVDAAAERFPRGGIYGILETSPDLLSQYERIVEKYHSKGVSAPGNALCMHYVAQMENDKAQSVYDKYLKNASRIMFQNVLRKARTEDNVDILENLWKLISSSPSLNQSAVGIIYSNKINIHLKKGNLETALSKLEEALKLCTLEEMNHSTLLRMKEASEAQNVKFNYIIPEKKKRKGISSSSSSSSDEAEQRTKTSSVKQS